MIERFKERGGIPKLGNVKAEYLAAHGEASHLADEQETKIRLKGRGIGGND